MPKLGLAGLLALTSRANIADIELLPLQELYYKFLYPYKFSFELTNGEVFVLKFDQEKFCHLIGLDKVPKALLNAGTRGWNHRRVSDYKGLRGWENILNGTIDMAHMISLSARVRNSMGESSRKLVNFYYLPQLMKTENWLLNMIILNMELQSLVN
ncbi:MAG TPA: PBECR4 domain-containing protein [Bacilli bacterium]